jgi:hypothetical protein
MKTFDYAKSLKDLYTATGKVKEVLAGKGVFLAVEGKGAPGGSAFQEAIGCLYTTAYVLKFALRYEGTIDFKIPKLECLYLSDPRKTKMSQWRWRLLLRLPDAASAKDVTATKKLILAKKGLDVSAVKRTAWNEGRAVQVMHVGPYDQVGPIHQELHEYAKDHGLKVAGPAHEIYISDPRATAPERLKTIVRLAVKKKGRI